MHITEGIIRGWPAVAYTAAGVSLMAVGARKMKTFVQDNPERKPLLGMGGAFIFFVSLIPIPAFTGTCSHPCGSPLAGILLGPWVGIALTGLSLLLQAAFFAHGGFSTWGANLITLGIGGAFFGWLAYRVALRAGCSIRAAAAAGGLVGDVMTYVLAGLSLGTVLSISPQPQYSWGGYLAAIYSAYLPTQGPIAIGEMFVTGLAIHYIFVRRPEVLESLGVISRASKPVLAPLLLLAMALGAATPAQAGTFAGMDEAVNERIAEEAGATPRAPYIDTESMGDLWNTLLLAAGGVSGFVIGRWWHLLFGGRDERKTFS
ncbi:MAG: hypothetical protein A3G34_01580 [Candidatus Lindowbacteria bacterium RIFCSPLOWO2_12_FULL_62_27]|nr:MAG: hypothetical protein A3I06_05910 [Candidatus Lindowbacteria bacterium RIFCSPLOWO2_02_FULL_62_12]OGH59003.1 MAG: hypothetical protein A3G34_01580 [Candidatus Lindowbacteria bacterium RIFCSPLOWO2_12_FULL_62_27]